MNPQEPPRESSTADKDRLLAVKKRLARPATALIVMASIQSVLVAIMLVSVVLMCLKGDPPVPIVLLGNGVQFACLLVIAIGAAKMGFLESIKMSRFAAFMACIPFVSPFMVLGIPFGIWALWLLKEPEVQAAFESAASLRRQA